MSIPMLIDIDQRVSYHEKNEMRTDVLKNRRLLVVNDMEEPAAPKRANRRLESMAFTADNFHLHWSIHPFRVCRHDPSRY